jgi:hypothetical protein
MSDADSAGAGVAERAGRAGAASLASFGRDATLLAAGKRGDGRHFVVRARIGGRDLVVKLYGRKRDAVRDFLRDVGQRLLVGKSGVRAARRAATERRVLALWRREGFDVPELIEDVALPAEIVQPRVVMEYVPGRTLDAFVADRSVALEEKRRVVTRLARELARRHARARALREPLLIQVHASLGHVLHVRAGEAGAGPAAAPSAAPANERLVTFDFEVAWTRRRGLEAMVRQEFTHYRDSLAKGSLPAERSELAKAFADGYAADVAGAVRVAARG